MLSAVAEYYDIRSELIPAIASGFCGGIGRTGNICGAVSGAVMAISLKAGRKTADEPLEFCYSLTRSLIKEFETTFGSSNCTRLTGCDLGTPEGQKFFRENNLIVQCRGYTMEATRLALNILKTSFAA